MLRFEGRSTRSKRGKKQMRLLSQPALGSIACCFLQVIALLEQAYSHDPGKGDIITCCSAVFEPSIKTLGDCSAICRQRYDYSTSPC